MRELVIDSSTIIDLYHADLLFAITRLPYKFCFVNILQDELLYPTVEQLLHSGWSSISIDGSAPAHIRGELRQRYAGPSYYDFASLLAALDREAILITGDAKLRHAAEEKKVMVHGILWMLDELVIQAILTPLQAAASLKMILEKGSWLPMDECKKRLENWQTHNAA